MPALVSCRSPSPSALQSPAGCNVQSQSVSEVHPETCSCHHLSTILTNTFLATRPTMQSKLLKPITPMEAELELLELLGYSSLSEKGYFLDGDTLESLSDHKIAQSNVSITDLDCGQFRASSPFSVMDGADSQHMSQSRRTKNHVCRLCNGEYLI